MHPTFACRPFEDDAYLSVEGSRDPAKHAQRVTFVAGGFETADLLLRCFEPFCEILLRKPGLLAQRGDLDRYVPGLTGALKAGGKRRIPELVI